MTKPTDVDWPSEIRVLRQLLPMTTTVHVVATDALLQQLTKLRRKPEGEQKVLAIRLIAEAMSALEDFGALCRAVRRRDDGGLIWNYCEYPQSEISKVYEAMKKERPAWNYLRLYAPAEYVDGPDGRIWDLDLSMKSAAKWYQVSGMKKLYNKTKHGFTVLAAPPEEEKLTQADDGETVYVLSKFRQDGRPVYIQVQKLREWPEKAKMVVETCSEGWRQLADLVILMHERGELANLPP